MNSGLRKASRRAVTLAVIVATIALQAAVIGPASSASIPRPPPGYWLAAADGGVFAFGGVDFHGAATRSPSTVVGIASTRSGRGYWTLTDQGQVSAFGDGADLGGISDPSAAPAVALVPTRSGRGYWIATLDGGVYTFGDAAFYGSTGATRLAQPVVGITATPSGRGYWLVALDGGVFSFGDAAFHGSTGAIRLAQPVVGMTRPGAGTSGGAWYALGGSGITWPGPRQAALTFDDGPHPVYTLQILDVLARYGVRATFFEVGRSVSMWPYLSRAIYDAGHSVQNHSWSHPHLPSLSETAIRGQLSSTSDVVQSATGVRPSCMRPPGGGTNANVVAIAGSLGLEQILWNVNPSDYLRPGAATITARSLQYADGRPLVIGMHDGGGPREQTVAALPSIIEGLRARGYELVRLCR